MPHKQFIYHNDTTPRKLRLSVCLSVGHWMYVSVSQYVSLFVCLSVCPLLSLCVYIWVPASVCTYWHAFCIESHPGSLTCTSVIIQVNITHVYTRIHKKHIPLCVIIYDGYILRTTLTLVCMICIFIRACVHASVSGHRLLEGYEGRHDAIGIPCSRCTGSSYLGGRPQAAWSCGDRAQPLQGVPVHVGEADAEFRQCIQYLHNWVSIVWYEKG